jgi:hypothetical protein
MFKSFGFSPLKPKFVGKSAGKSAEKFVVFL